MSTQPKYVVLRNSFHCTSYVRHKSPGQPVSRSTMLRVQHALCGLDTCQCSGMDGTRDSRYRISYTGNHNSNALVVVDNCEGRE